MKHINTLHGPNAEFFNVKIGGINSNQYAFKKALPSFKVQLRISNGTNTTYNTVLL